MVANSNRLRNQIDRRSLGLESLHEAISLLMQAPFPETAVTAKSKLGSLRGHDFEFLSDLYTDYNVCPPPDTPRHEENKEVIFDEIVKGSDFYRMSPEPRKSVFADVDWQGDEDLPRGPPSEAADSPHLPSQLLRNLSQWRPQQEETGDKAGQQWAQEDSARQSSGAKAASAGKPRATEEHSTVQAEETEQPRNRPSEPLTLATSGTKHRLREAERQDREKTQASGPDRKLDKDQRRKETRGTDETDYRASLPTDLRDPTSQLQPGAKGSAIQPVSEPAASTGRSVSSSDGKSAGDVGASLPGSDSSKKGDQRSSRSPIGPDSQLQGLGSKSGGQKSGGTEELGKLRKPLEARSHQVVESHSTIPADSSESLDPQRDQYPKLSPAKSDISKQPPFLTVMDGDVGQGRDEDRSSLKSALLKASPTSSTQPGSEQVETAGPSADRRPFHSGSKGPDHHAQTPIPSQRKTPLGKYKKTGTLSLVTSPLTSVRDLAPLPEDTPASTSIGKGSKRTASLHTSGFDKGDLRDRGLDNSEERLMSAASRPLREGLYSFGNTAQFQPFTEELEVLQEKRRKRKKKPKKLPPLKLVAPPLAINSPDDLAGAYGLPVRKSGKTFALAPLKSTVARANKE